MRKLEKIVQGSPAFDKRNPDPNKNYGVHGVSLRFVLKGTEGAVQFVLYTNWHLPHVQEEFDRHKIDPRFPHLHCHPMPADLGYHSHVARYEGQTPMGQPCEYLDGRDCYYDGSSLNAQEVYEKLLHGGLDAVWKELLGYYRDTFSVEDVEL